MLYKCPKCGRTVDLPKGNYYCKTCGPSYSLIPAKEHHSTPQYPEEVKSLRSWMWSIFHAVEERDWERLPAVFDWPEFKKDVEKAKPYFHGRYDVSLDSYIRTLRGAVLKRDPTLAFETIAEILLCLEPAVPWMH